MIWHLYTLQNDHHSKFGYCVSPYEVNTIWLIFPMLYITSPWLIYFISGSLYFLDPFHTFCPAPTPCLWQPRICSLCLGCASYFLFDCAILNHLFASIVKLTWIKIFVRKTLVCHQANISWFTSEYVEGRQRVGYLSQKKLARAVIRKLLGLTNALYS